jgi:hypothetical protein
MSVRSRYKGKFLAEKVAETIPPSEKIALDAPPNADAVTAPNDEALAKATDEATARLQRQLAELQRSEQLQRQAAAMPQRPLSREEKLTAWRAQGMSAEDERTLTERPQMIDHDRLTALAAHSAAQQGHERGTAAHREATRQIFDEHWARLQAQAQPPAEPPQFFKPPSAPEPPSAASIVSAPVSRGEVGGYREPSPSQVKLSGEEREIARAAGISEVEYAKHKLAMLRKQRAGEIQH